jgi:hypothetical protein
MNTLVSHIKTLSAAAVVAVALGAGSFAAPAFAQDGPPSGFSINVPDGGQSQSNPSMPAAPGSDGSTSTRSGSPSMQGHYDPGNDDFYYCLEDDEVVDALEDYGFTRARVTRHYRGERVEATAYWGRNQYSMRVDLCSGAVDRVRLIRRGGFGLQFNFSN